jgi:predicted AAA+ superfamily ATPase
MTTPTVSLAHLLKGTAQTIGGHSAFLLHDYADAITHSGFPGIMSTAPRLRRSLLGTYVQRIIDRDVPEQGYNVRRPETLKRWLSAYAAASSTTTAYSRLLDATTSGDSFQPAKTTTIEYRDTLSQLWLLDPVPGWIPANNPIRRLQQAPKHQLADPALAARLLGLSTETLLGAVGAHMAGPLFESLVTLGIRVAAQAAEATVSHLRLTGGDREVDLIVEGVEGQILGVEIKLAPDITNSDVRHLLWLREQIPDKVVDLVVVTTGTTAYRRPDGVAVVPLALLGA